MVESLHVIIPFLPYTYFNFFVWLHRTRAAVTHPLSSCPRATLALCAMSGTETFTLSLTFSLPLPLSMGVSLAPGPSDRQWGVTGGPGSFLNPLLFFILLTPRGLAPTTDHPATPAKGYLTQSPS